MQQLILKENLSEVKMKALIEFLKNWDIEVEFKSISKITSKTNKEFSLSTGIWKDMDIDAKTLRNDAWKR